MRHVQQRFVEQIFGCQRPVILQLRFHQSKSYMFEGAPYSVHRQSADLPVAQQRRVPTEQTMQKTVEIPQVLFLGRRRCDHAATQFSGPQTSSSTAAFSPHFAAFFALLLTELSPRCQRTFLKPSMANSCWSSRARGWRGRRESDCQAFCHVLHAN